MPELREQVDDLALDRKTTVVATDCDSHVQSFLLSGRGAPEL
jgi:hypothetical protein